MKKFIFLITLFAASLAASAQTPNGYTAFANDSTTNVQTKYLALASPVAITGNYTVGLSCYTVNSSGTATVTATPQASNLGTLWFDIGSAVTVNNAGTVAPYGFQFTSAPFRYYRIKCVSSGTGVTRLTGYISLKRINF